MRRMRPEKAIEILQHNYQSQPRSWYRDYFMALRLGIEALEAIAFWNDKQLPQHQIHLPSAKRD